APVLARTGVAIHLVGGERRPLVRLLESLRGMRVDHIARRRNPDDGRIGGAAAVPWRARPDERVAVRIVDLLADLAGAPIALVARAGVPCVAKLKPAAADVGGAGLPEIDRDRAVRRRHFERVDVTRVALDVTFRVTVAIVALRPRASPFHLFVVVAEVVQV